MSTKDAKPLTSCVISGSLSLIQHLPVFESLPPVWTSLLLCCILQSVPEGRPLESCKRQAQHTCTIWFIHTCVCKLKCLTICFIYHRSASRYWSLQSKTYVISPANSPTFPKPEECCTVNQDFTSFMGYFCRIFAIQV